MSFNEDFLTPVNCSFELMSSKWGLERLLLPSIKKIYERVFIGQTYVSCSCQLKTGKVLGEFLLSHRGSHHKILNLLSKPNGSPY